jgi:hypothetical protein
MLLTNPIEEDVFERTNENEDEEKVCEKERARRRLLLEEESSSSSSAAKVAFAFLSPKSSSSSLGKTEEEKVVETIAFFSNSRVPLTVCEEILSSFKKKNKKFEKIGHVKVSGVSERNDCLSDDFDDDDFDDENTRNETFTRTCDVYYQRETKIALVKCTYDVPVENATRWAETVLKSLFPDDDDEGRMRSRQTSPLRKAFVVTSFVSSYADDTDADENGFGDSARFAVQYVGNEAYTTYSNTKTRKNSTNKKPLSVGRAVVGAEAALFNRLNQMANDGKSAERTRTKIALLTCPDERSFSGTADDIIDVRALKNIVDVLREDFDDDENTEEKDEWSELLRSVDETALNEWARKGGRHRNRHHLQRDATNSSISFVADDNLFS